MTNKIIDGIDVSECFYALTPKKQCPNKSMPYAKETSCTVCKQNITQHNFCKNNPNCYYKQLKRKEQECKKLKEENILLHEIINKQNQALYEIEEILNTRHRQGHGFCDTRLPLILNIINKTKEQK